MSGHLYFVAESFVYQRSVSHQLGSNACALKMFWGSFGSSFYLLAKTTLCQGTKQCNWGPTRKQEALLPLTKMLKPSHISNSFRTFKGSQLSAITNTKDNRMEVEIPFIREHKYKRPQAFERESNVSDSSNAVACSGKGSSPHFPPPSQNTNTEEKRKYL